MNTTRFPQRLTWALLTFLACWTLAFQSHGQITSTLTILDTPATTSTTEDTAGSFTVKTTSTGEFDVIVGTSSDETLLPSSSINVKRISGTTTVFWKVTYTPAKDKSGFVDIRLKRYLGALFGPTVVATATITAVEDPPTITEVSPASVSMDEDNEQTVEITVDDVDSTERSISVTAASDNAALIPNDATSLKLSGTDATRVLTIKPAPNASGSAKITITASNAGGTDTKVINVTVNAVSDPPHIDLVRVGSGLTYVPIFPNLVWIQNDQKEDQPFDLELQVSDAETPAESISVNIASINTALVKNSDILQTTKKDGLRIYRIKPAANKTGTVTLSAVATDGAGRSDSVDIKITIVEANDPPVITANDVSVLEDSSVLWTVNVEDTLDSANNTPAEEIAVKVVSSNQTLLPDSNISLVTVAGTNRLFTITPIANLNGKVQLTITAADAQGAVSTLTKTLTVNAQNDPPVAGSTTGLTFDGSTTRIEVPGISLTNQSFTIEFWASSATANTEQTIFWLGSDTTVRKALSIGYQKDGPLSMSLNGKTIWTDSSTAPKKGIWTHWACVFDDLTKTTSLYQNGVLQKSQSGFTELATIGKLYLGYSPVAGTSFNGVVDEVRVWNVARLEAEIRRDYRAFLTGRETGLIGYWRFDEGTGNIAFDSASDLATGRNNGVILGNGAPGWTTATNRLTDIVVNENTPTSIFLPGFDREFYQAEAGATLSFRIIDGPTYGTLAGITIGKTNSWSLATVNPVLYTPTLNHKGPDRFTYQLVDNAGAVSATNIIQLSIQDKNDAPIIGPLSDINVLESTSTGAVPINIFDPDNSAGDISVYIRVSPVGNALLPNDTNHVILIGSGTDRTLQLKPTAGQIGTVVVDVVAVDSGSDALSSTRSFKFRVDPIPAYAVIDVGSLDPFPGFEDSEGLGVSDAGWVVGSTIRSPIVRRPFVWQGLGGTAKLQDLGVAGSILGINQSQELVGYQLSVSVPASLKNEALLWKPDPSGTGFQAINLQASLASLGADSTATAINDLGTVVGSLTGTVSGRSRGFRLSTRGTLSTNLLAPASAGHSSEARAINNAGTVAGLRKTSAGESFAVLWDATNKVTNLTNPSGTTNSMAVAINDNGQVVVTAETNGLKRSYIYRMDTLQYQDLGTFPEGGKLEAMAINRFGQVTGSGMSPSGSSAAALYSAGALYNLNDLIGDPGSANWSAADWNLKEARAISANGTIAGTGSLRGSDHAFMAVPAWVIGRPIAFPEGSVARLPEIEILSAAPGDNALNAFFWSEAEKRLYAIRPVTARIKWFTSFSDLLGSGASVTANTDRIVVYGISVWPKHPTLHVKDAPALIEPKGVPFAYSFQSVIYNPQSASVDPTSKSFTCTSEGYSVIYYLRTNGDAPSPQTQSPYFDVVKTVRWDDPLYLRKRSAEIGSKLADPPSETDKDPGHQEYSGLNGYVLNANSPYDGSGESRAHDRPTRMGPIITVNDGTASHSDQMVVIWYRMNAIGVAWPSVPAQYSLSWPEAPETLVIASQLGSGPLPSATFLNPRVYNQPDPSLPGFNPNEEHALIAPSNGGVGNALFALRTDLNAIKGHSLPYALLKYQSPEGEWNMRVYQVVPENRTYKFKYTSVAGNVIDPPYPLNLLNPLAAKSKGVEGPWWEDYKGRIYARAAGPGGEPAGIVIRWFYPLQPDFYYDLDSKSGPDAAPETQIAWFDHRQPKELEGKNDKAGEAGVPMDVVYDVRWPKVPTLQIGETLTTSKNGLPNVSAMAKLEFIHDDLTPEWNPLGTDPAPINTLARLYDPLSVRILKLDTSEAVPDAIKRVSRSGKEQFTDLPPTLRTRLEYDPINRWLMFHGTLDTTSYTGEPLLLPNVMTLQDRDRVQRLVSPTDKGWNRIIDRLYELTRNPNSVDLDQNGVVDTELRIGLTTEYTYETNSAILRLVGTGNAALDKLLRENSVSVTTNVTLEPFGALPKALTAGLGSLPAAQPDPGMALQFAGGTVGSDAGSLDLGSAIDFTGSSFTIEFWAQRSGSGVEDPIVSQDGSPTPLQIGFRASNKFAFNFPGNVLEIDGQSDTGWHHWACVWDQQNRQRLVYRDGRLVGSGAAAAGIGTGRLRVGKLGADFLHGQLDELRIWLAAKPGAILARDRSKRLQGDEDMLVALYRFDETEGKVIGQGPLGAEVPFNGVGRVASGAETGIRPRYLTLAENNDPALGALPVVLHIIRIDDGPFLGDLKAILPDNAFDERLTLRNSNDFGTDPDVMDFEWYYHPADDAYDPNNPALLPEVKGDGTIGNLKGWLRYTGGPGRNEITLGDSAESGLFTITDNFWICRYRGYAVGLNDGTTWSDWVGDPAGKSFPIPLLGEGWVKRVIRSLNPFDQRTKDFHTSEVSTYASMLEQAGGRYEGPIAFNPDADAINSIGLIETYSTVLDVARRKSIDGTPAVNYNPANNALILAASKISDLYMLLGNEAFADAADPTIGFGTTGGDYGTLASSIFAFQNQLDSLLDEELALLRGRDNSSGGVQAPPVYNRLLWNFTLGEGEVAYQQVYNIQERILDGFIDEKDARVMYPQGHGDAWGHYLTALTGYYELLQHPNFTWVPRAETVNVAGQGVQVDFLDERKFANAAAARAKAGGEIVNLTYRRSYTGDPSGQWQGYKDTDKDRAWGVAEWASRSVQGAYFDWATANTILQAVDPNPAHTGLTKIDRTTVPELGEITSQAASIQATLDQSDQGLNPLGVAPGAIPFDIDPTFLEVGSTAQIGRRAVQGLFQFDQILERAIGAMNNAVNVWDQANRSTELLRKSQDAQVDFSNNIIDQERDFKNRLIELYGYPYAGDIGPGKTYPSGYDGPDLFHYMYVDNTAIDTATAPISTNFTAYFKPMKMGSSEWSYTFNDGIVADPSVLETSILPVLCPLSDADYGFQAPSSWGKRRAPGEIQMALSDCVQGQASLLDALQTYCGLIADIQGQLDLLKNQRNIAATEYSLRSVHLAATIAVDALINSFAASERFIRRISDMVDDLTDAGIQGLPNVIGVASDPSFLARAGLKNTSAGSRGTLLLSAEAAASTQSSLESAKEVAGLGLDLTLDIAESEFEIAQRVKEIEHMMRDEYNLRIAAYKEAEVLRQNVGRYYSLLGEAQRVLDQRLVFRQRAAAATSRARYQDMTFRIFRNDAIQKYRATFDLAAKYVYLAANAYDYEVNFGASDPAGAARFKTDIVRQRSLGQMVDGNPAVGQPGLADSLARMEANWNVLKTQFGIIQPQISDLRFSLREELFRISGDTTQASANKSWRHVLTTNRVDDVWQIPEFRRYCRPFAPESAGAQPAIVIKFPTMIEFGRNFFGWELAAGDSAYDSSQYSTKIARAGIWFSGTDGSTVAQVPRVYLVPVGVDIMRTPTGDDFLTREFKVVDQVIPPPFPIGASDFKNPGWIPINDSLGGSFIQIRRHAAMPARHDAGIYAEQDLTNDTRLIGRSAWNTQWMLIIPGGTLLADPNEGLDRLIESLSDIKIYFQAYSYSGL